MKKSFKLMMGLVIAVALPMFLTSCEDILGEWSKPAPTPATPSTPDTPTESAKYNVYSWDATEKVTKATPTDIPTTGVTTDEDLGTTWSGTIVINNDKTISGNVKLTSDVDLIIKDGVELKVVGRIYGGEDGMGYPSYDYSLRIYGQSESTGKLTLDADGDQFNICVKGIEIHGGVITGINATQCIENAATGVFDIYHGTIDITGTLNGIMAASDLNIYGGTLTATSTNGGPGGGGPAISGTNITIYDGIVNATGAQSNTTPVTDAWDGIQGNTITIEGGNITAKGGASLTNADNGGDGISALTSITINGGAVTAVGGDGAGPNGNGGNGIGDSQGAAVPVKITNCTRITATGGVKGGGTGVNGYCIGSSGLNIGTTLKYSVDEGANWTNGTVADLDYTIHQNNRSMIIIPQ